MVQMGDVRKDDLMIDRLQKACEHELERYVEMMFSAGSESALAACLRELADPIECYFQLADLDNRAKQARAWFAKREPCRFQPLPLVYYNEQETVMCGSNLPRH